MTKAAPTMLDMFSQFQPDAMKESFQKAQAFWTDMGQLNKEGLAAMSESAKLTTKGFESLSERTAAFFKDNMAAGLEVTRDMSGVKTVQDAFELQSSFAKANLEKYVTEAGEVTALMADTARAAGEPISAHIEIVVDKFQTMA